MTPENSRKLYEAYPHLYRGKDKGAEESSMCWGFQCDDGWFDLIWKLSADIENVAKNEGHNPDDEDWPEAKEVKQKFGQLRFRVNPIHETIEALIDEAQKASLEICEVCGAQASLDTRNRRKIRTVCPNHALEPPNQRIMQ